MTDGVQRMRGLASVGGVLRVGAEKAFLNEASDEHPENGDGQERVQTGIIWETEIWGRGLRSTAAPHQRCGLLAILSA